MVRISKPSWIRSLSGEFRQTNTCTHVHNAKSIVFNPCFLEFVFHITSWLTTPLLKDQTDELFRLARSIKVLLVDVNINHILHLSTSLISVVAS